jgi:hypothetical protein
MTTSFFFLHSYVDGASTGKSLDLVITLEKQRSYGRLLQQLKCHTCSVVDDLASVMIFKYLYLSSTRHCQISQETPGSFINAASDSGTICMIHKPDLVA